MKSYKADVVILGAGFAGIRAARLIGRLADQLKLRVLLIDREDHHIYTPSLYEIVGGHAPRQVCIPIQETIAGLPVEFLQASVKNLSVSKRTIELADGGQVEFRYLIIALGSGTNYYGIPGVEEHAYPLKTARDAWLLRQHIEVEFAKAAASHSSDDQQRHIRFLVAGGGPAGVELAGELALVSRRLARLHHIPRQRVHIELLEASPEILGRSQPKTIAYARSVLRALGVAIHTTSPVKKDRVRSVIFGSTKEASETLIWTAGVTPPAFIKKLKAFEHDRAGRIVVDGFLRAHGAENIWVVGDCASVQDSGTAFAAIAQASCAAGNVVRAHLHEQQLAYDPTTPAMAMPVGRQRGVVQYDNLVVTGPIVRLAKALIDIHYFSTILPLSKAIKLWLVRRESCPNCGRRYRQMLWPNETIA